MKATCLLMEEEVEYELCLMMDVVKEKLKSMITPEGSPMIEIWHTPFYDIKVISNYICLVRLFLGFVACLKF